MKLFFGFILIKQNLQEKISRFPHESRFVSCDMLTPHLALHLSCSGVVSKPAIYELAVYIPQLFGDGLSSTDSRKGDPFSP